MEHEIKIINNGGVCAEVHVDDMPLCGCIGYTISQTAGELPKITLDLLPKLYLEIKGELSIANLGDLARVMDEKLFDEFCVMWHSLHGCV